MTRSAWFCCVCETVQTENLCVCVCVGRGGKKPTPGRHGAVVVVARDAARAVVVVQAAHGASPELRAAAVGAVVEQPRVHQVVLVAGPVVLPPHANARNQNRAPSTLCARHGPTLLGDASPNLSVKGTLSAMRALSCASKACGEGNRATRAGIACGTQYA
jgi:hypothetical protein